MDGSQQLAGAGAVSLLLVNVWKDHGTFTAGAFNSSASGEQTAAAHALLKRYAAALLGIVALMLLAGTSPTAGKAAVTVVAALWLLWLMLHLGQPAAGSSGAARKPAAPSGPTHRGTIGPRTAYAV